MWISRQRLTIQNPNVNTLSLHQYINPIPVKHPVSSSNSSATLTIKLDSPQDEYQPGDVIRGSLDLHINKSIAIQSVELTFQGTSSVRVVARVVDADSFPNQYENITLFRQEICTPLPENNDASTRHAYESDTSFSWPFTFEFPAGYDPDSKVSRWAVNGFHLLHDTRTVAQKNAGVLLDLPPSMRWKEKRSGYRDDADEAYVQYSLAATLIEDEVSTRWSTPGYGESKPAKKMLVTMPLQFSPRGPDPYDKSPDLVDKARLLRQFEQIDLKIRNTKIPTGAESAHPKSFWKSLKGNSSVKHTFDIEVQLQNQLQLTLAVSITLWIKLKAASSGKDTSSATANIRITVKTISIDLKVLTVYEDMAQCRMAAEHMPLLKQAAKDEVVIELDDTINIGQALELCLPEVAVQMLLKLPKAFGTKNIRRRYALDWCLEIAVAGQIQQVKSSQLIPEYVDVDLVSIASEHERRAGIGKEYDISPPDLNNLTSRS